MTEEEWLSAADPMPLWEHLSEQGSDRKHWLFAVCCVHRVGGEAEAPLLDAVEVAERYVDGLAARDEMRSACELLDYFGMRENVDTIAGRDVACFVIEYCQDCVAPNISEESVIQARRFGDIFGNPFRPVILDPRWRTETAVSLASGIYVDRAFDRMPILADALEEAGCDNADMLAHCRGDEPHVRGCWVVDLVLGKG